MLQWKPLNGITLGHTKRDKIITLMIPLTDYVYHVIYSKWDVDMWSY